MRGRLLYAMYGIAFGLLIGACVNIGNDVAVEKQNIDVWEAMGAPPTEKVNARLEWCRAFRDGLMAVTEYSERRARLEVAFQDCVNS